MDDLRAGSAVKSIAVGESGAGSTGLAMREGLSQP